MIENQKPKTKNQKPLLRICVPVVEATVNRARGKYQRAARKGLWTEIRLDYLEEPAPDLGQKLYRSLPGPVIATNRLATEGGRWTGTEAGRLALLTEALNLGVTCLDVELAADVGLPPGGLGPPGKNPAHLCPGTTLPAPRTRPG